MHVVFGVLLIVHGLITAAISAGSFTTSADMPNPAWLQWWPTQLGRSWIAPELGWPGGLLWLLAGVLLVGAGLGFLGILIPWWSPLAVVGAVLALIAIVVYFHPYYILAAAINIAILWIALHPDSSAARIFL